MIIVLFSCSQPDYDSYLRLTSDMAPVSRNLTLGPGDVFEVRVFGEKDLSNIYRVSSQGEITFPLVGRINVDKLSPTQVETIIEQKLIDGYIRNPYVTVFVKEYNSKKISVVGQVPKAGTFSYQPGMSIIEAISMAGGLLDSAQANSVIVTRSEGGQEIRYEIPVQAISEGEVPNFYLRPGDIVFIPKSIL